MQAKRISLIEEIIDEIKEELPSDIDIAEWLDNGERFLMPGMNSENLIPLGYQYGRLLGCAEWSGMSVIELLESVKARKSTAFVEMSGSECSPGCLGWDHFNVGGDREGIERCDACDAFEDDYEAAKAHDKHCRCGAGVDLEIESCHGCRGKVQEVVIHNNRAFCSNECAAHLP